MKEDREAEVIRDVTELHANVDNASVIGNAFSQLHVFLQLSSKRNRES